MIQPSLLDKMICKIIISNKRILLYILLFNQHHNLRQMAIEEALEKKKNI